ncbi:MAG: 16S rRNA (cytosine(1402)-N(4))-methyltransferase RsmH [Actinobacteria bacterium]|nr:16S rRNA (cytosine(1402)-N(4))-methyltransferase RsmH [Actinomycetota bacterium]
MSQVFEHEPVMVGEVVALFAPVPPGAVVDATVGGGGHARALLMAHPHLTVIGLDQDEEAIAAARQALSGFAGRVELHHARFDVLADPGRAVGPGRPAALPGPITGFLLDLGVSSHQLDSPERGFSIRHSALLDMRMDRRQTRTAADLVNDAPEGELRELFVQNGEGRLAGRIARAIVAARPLYTTGQLAEVVRAAVPAMLRRRGHPATRVFQALRIAVNDELGVLARTLDAAIDTLAPGGRIVVLSYHSGEDRLVKERFLAASTGGCICPPQLPCVCGARPQVRLLNRGARMASPAEVSSNPRSSAARLRAVEKLPDVTDEAPGED